MVTPMFKIKPLRPPVFLGSEIKTQQLVEIPEAPSEIIAFGVELIINSMASPSDFLPDLVITSPDKTHSIDYVAVSLHSALTTEPCPDLLVDVWQALQKFDFLSIDWCYTLQPSVLKVQPLSTPNPYF
ncbi:hypothetical protein AMATHDRAFT_8638 [Amanita thiersii Skay4041]|uniref:Uncharacterized protein n=1 Tax=Amanita thiersii Skay4041 TaxID=703135 RepID=A0A2A9NDF0_9AGAR|nr:hypothetical protein AMATHDRAFT_8638 [Amanita thiersii Skay4041]